LPCPALKDVEVRPCTAMQSLPMYTVWSVLPLTPFTKIEPLRISFFAADGVGYLLLRVWGPGFSHGLGFGVRGLGFGVDVRMC
jgi:hypothetical protein